jgi:CHASE2 domain-containing sensor protein
MAAAAIALAGLAFGLSPWCERASLAILDAGFGILREIRPGAAPDDIVVVGLDASSPEAEPGGQPLRKLPEILVRVSRGGPRAIALLTPLPRESLEAAFPGLDDALATALSVAQAAAPFTIGITVDARREVVPIHERLLRGLDTRALAFSLLPRDEDGVVRQVVLGLPTQQGKWPTTAGWLCEVLGGRCVPGLIDYALGPAYRYVPARRVLETKDDAALARLFGGRIVFVAPVAGPEDRVRQPVSLAGWEAPTREPAAVLAHAQTVRTLLHGNSIGEVTLPAIALAVAAAALVVLVSAPLAPAVGGLALAGALAGGLLALRLGWYVPLAAPNSGNQMLGAPPQPVIGQAM